MHTEEEKQEIIRAYVAQEEIRSEALIRSNELPYDVLGFDLRPLTLKDFNILKFCGNSFIRGGERNHEDCIQLIQLQLTSQENSLREIARKVLEDEETALIECTNYVESFFIDAQEGGGEGAGTGYSVPFEYSMIDLLAREYGWDEERIQNISLNRIFIYVNLINQRANRDYNPVDLVERTRLRIHERKLLSK